MNSLNDNNNLNRSLKLTPDVTKTTRNVVDKQNKHIENNTKPNSYVRSQKTENVKRKTTIKGTNEDITDLQTVKQMGWIFISGLDPKTTKEKLVNYVRKFKEEDIILDCEKLNTNNESRVASFKLGVPSECKKDVMDEKLWPKGTILNHFFMKNRFMKRKM